MSTHNNLTLSAATTFHPFPRLPAELQHQIWGWAFFAVAGHFYWEQPTCPNWGSPLFCVHSRLRVCLRGCNDIRGQRELFISASGPFTWCADHFPFTYDDVKSMDIYVEPGSTLPALLSTCHESRKWALKMWKEVWQEHNERVDEYDQLLTGALTLEARMPHFDHIYLDASEYVQAYLFEQRSGTKITDFEELKAFKLRLLVAEEICSAFPGLTASGEAKKWKKGTIGRVKWFEAWDHSEDRIKLI